MRNLSNNIVDLWRKFCWRAIYLGPRRDITIDSSNGLLTVDSKDWLIGKYLYVRRQHETGEMEQVAKLLNKEGYLGSGSPPSTVLNVGANIGMTAIGLLRNGFFKRAVAFEPTPNSFRLLGLNIQQNGLSDRIQSFPIALSAANGEFDLELSRDNSGDNRISVTTKPGFFDEQKRRTVKVKAKHSIASSRRIPHCALSPSGLPGWTSKGTRGISSAAQGNSSVAAYRPSARFGRTASIGPACRRRSSARRFQNCSRTSMCWESCRNRNALSLNLRVSFGNTRARAKCASCCCCRKALPIPQVPEASRMVAFRTRSKDFA